MIGLLPAGFLEWSCQDISIAGKGAGIGGERSGLWFEMFRAIRILRPMFAIIENVSAITFRGLDTVLSTLAEIGYDAEWQNIRASDMGAPHRRERIWIVAYPGYMFGGDEKQNAIRESKENRMQRHTIAGSSKIRDVAYPSSNRWPRQGQTAEIKKGSQPEPEDAGKLEVRLERCRNDVADSESRKSGEQTEREGREDISGGSEEFSDTDKTRLQTQGAEKQAAGITGNNTKFPDASVERLERPAGRDRREPKLSAECNWWSVEPHVGMLVDGLPSGMDRFKGRQTDDKYERINQLKCLGNSIVPAIAELLFEQIKIYL